jgi:predicted TIM-barrel fold metal-dependent hydrolase
MSLHRRTWLASTGAAAALATLTNLPADDAAALPIVDTHQHLWDLDKFNLPWLGKGGELHRNFVTKDYLAATAGLNVVKAVYMEVDVAEDQKDLEAEHLIALTKQKNQPTVAAVIGCRLASPHFGDYVRRYRDQSVIKGFRQVLGAGQFDDTFVENLQLLSELDKSFDLCLPARDLGEAVKVVDKCPHTRFILDHCGNADVKAFLPESRRPGHKPAHDVNTWKRNIDAMAQRKNVICKISGVIAGVPKEWSADDLAPVVNHCLDCFGPERVVFGSDWPVCLKGATLQQWVTALKEIIASRPLQDQRRLLAENAMRHYRLA